MAVCIFSTFAAANRTANVCAAKLIWRITFLLATKEKFVKFYVRKADVKAFSELVDLASVGRAQRKPISGNDDTSA